MADLKISELSALTGANLAAADELAIVSDAASETKKITVSDLIANGVTVISDDTIPGAKILFAAGDIATAALADSAVTTAKVADDAVTAAKLANESTVDLVTTLPASGAFTGQLALDTDDNSLYAWDGSAWQSLKAPGSINTVSGSTTGEVNIVATTSGSTVTVSATLDDTTAAAQFLAGPTGAAGTVGYRAISGTDLPTATTSAKGGVIVNGNGLTMDSDTIEIDNTVTASSTHHVVTYNAQGLITGGRAITSADLPIATTSAVGGVIAGSGLAVDVSGNLSIDNTVTSGTYTKVTVSAQGVVTAGDTLGADDIPDHSAAKLTSGTIGTSLIANDAITAAKMADQSTVLFGGALGSDNVTIFPAGDYKGQMFWDETSEDLYIYTGSAFIPITVLSGNLVNAGAYNANTNTMSSVTTAGSSAGFSAGSALPAPAATNLNHYVVVDTSGTGSGAAPAVALAPPDMLLSQGVGTEYALIDVSNAIAGQTASNISVIASGNIAATDVQAALQELDTEKLQKAGDTMTGALGIGTASSIVFEGSSADDYETTLTVTDPTADRTITLPNITGTVVTTGDTGSVTSTMILDGTIANADISSTAEIAVSKLANGTARQLLQTDSAGTGVEFTSNVDVPGTLDVTGAATLDSTLTVTGLISADGKVSFPAGTAAAPSLYSGSDTDTGIYSPGSDQFGITTGGTAAVTVDSSQRVGVGITSPNYELHVHDASGSSTIQLTNGTVGSASTDGARITGSTNGILYFENLENAATVFTTNNTERVRIDGSGNVGIGTSTARAGLTVALGGDAIPAAGASTGSALFGNATDDGVYGVVLGANTSGVGYIQAQRGDGTATTYNLAIQPNGGNVGIGTTSPGSTLELSSAATSAAAGVTVTNTNAAGYSTVQFKNTGASGRTYTLALGGSTSVFPGSFYLYDDTAGTSRVLVDSSGNVGIGTTSPQAITGYTVLTLNNATQGGAIEFKKDGTSYGRLLQGSSSMVLETRQNIPLIFGTGSGSGERMRIDSSGNIGIGYSSPNVLLTLNSSSTNCAIGFRQSNNEEAYIGTSGFTNGLINGAVAGDLAIRAQNQNINFSVDSGVGYVMRIASNGRIGMANDTSGYSERLGVTETNLGSNGHCIITFVTGTSSKFHHRFVNGNGVVGSIITGGSSTSFNTSSDYRLKENVVNIADGITRVKQLQPKRFNFIADSTTIVDGFLAHEAQTVVPEAVTGTHNQVEVWHESDELPEGVSVGDNKLDEDGNTIPVMQGIDQSKLVPLLTAALQEAIAKIETLETKVAALEAA